MPLEASVSNIELYRTWTEQEGLDLSWLIQKLTVREQTEKMKAGEAFHKALEQALDGEFEFISALDYRFYFRIDTELCLMKIREGSVSRDYDGLLVRGRVDLISGRTVEDVKTTEQFDADRLFEGMQWRFYLDMCAADCFNWHVFQMKEIEDKVYDVYGYHKLSQCRYPSLRQDCERAAAEYKRFAEQHLTVAA